MDIDFTNDDIRESLEGLDGLGEDDLFDDGTVSHESLEAASRFISAMGAEGPSPFKGHDWTVQVPSDLLETMGEGPLYGILRPETESVYVIDAPTYRGDPARLIGAIGDCAHDGSGMGDAYWVQGSLGVDGPSLEVIHSVDGEVLESWPARIRPYDTVTRLFSRNAGLLESDVMLDTCAVIVGAGSVGSLVAMELARSGVGRFVLVDTDTLEIHNICRHQCGFEDLGRPKVEAVRDRILNINPYAEVATYRSVIQRVPREELDGYLGRSTIVVGTGDNRASSAYACRLACETDSSFVSVGCWSRACAGEVFYWQSGHGLACYECALGDLIDDERPESHQRYFGSDEDESVAFEPGIAVDIDFVTTIAVKLALDLLNRDNDAHTPRLINHLRQYTWICNTNDPAVGGERAAIFSRPLQVTTNLRVMRRPDCPHCGSVEREPSVLKLGHDDIEVCHPSLLRKGAFCRLQDEAS